MTDFILLMGHGSRCAMGATEFLDLVDAVREAAPSQPIETGFLEFGGPLVPPIQEGIDRCVARGARRVLAVPVLLFYAGHGKRDMPGQIALGRQRHPALDLVFCEALGIDRTLLEITEDRIATALAGLPARAAEETAILLVARGTTDGDANSDFCKVARLLWERNRFGWVEPGFISLAEPGVPAGIERCLRLGAKRVLVVPYFLNTGVLVQRIYEQARATRARFPAAEIELASHLSIDRRLVELVLARTQEVARSRAGHNLAGQAWRYQRGNRMAHLHEPGHHHGQGPGHHHGHAHGHEPAAPYTGFRHDHRLRLVPVGARPLPNPPPAGEGTAAALHPVGEGVAAGPQPAATRAANPHPVARVATGRLAPDGGRRGDPLAVGETGPPGPPSVGEAGPSGSLVARYALPPHEIEALSLRRVAGVLATAGSWSGAEREVVARMVYAAGDPDLAALVRLHPAAVHEGIHAVQHGALVVADVRMVEAALDRARLAQWGSEVRCAVEQPGAARAATASGLPRTLEGLRLLKPALDGAIVVIGNAPTALLALLDLVDAREVRPALIVGTPVGFVAAAESKAELAARDVPFITVEGTRGGSAIAAAAVNAIVRLAERHSHGHHDPAREHSPAGQANARPHP